MPCARNSAPPPHLLRLRLEHLDEQPADGLALRLRVGHAVERGEERLGRIHMDQRDVVVVAEHRHDLVRLVQPHQAVVDEDAGELVADRLVDQHRRDRGIDAAGEAADHPPLADLLADLADHLGAVGRHRPVGLQPDDLVDEIRRAASRHPACARPRGGTWSRSSGGLSSAAMAKGAFSEVPMTSKARGQRGDAVAVAHPDRIALADLPDAVEERARRLDLDIGAAEFAAWPPSTLPPSCAAIVCWP